MAINWENLPSTSTPLNAINLKKMLKWEEIARYTTTDSNTTVQVSNLSDYSELLVTVGASSTATRILNSIVIPMDVFLRTVADSSNGYYQCVYISSSNIYWIAGISYLGNNQIKLYNNERSNIVVYAR